MKRVALLVCVALVAGTPRVPAQAPSEATFDVASIRRSPATGQPGGGIAAPQPGGRFIAVRATLRRLISQAYDGVEIDGGPTWIDSDRFDVEARAAGAPSPAQIRRMLRPLLADRFKLAHHTETREVPVYELHVARADRRLGPGLRESDAKCAEEARNYFPSATLGFPPPCGDYRMGARAFTARGMTMAGLAQMLTARTGRPVHDRTGVAAAFDVQIEWSDDGGLERFGPDGAGPAAPVADGITLFTALQEQLGLRLQATNGRIDVLVIDRAEPPTPD